MTSGIECSQLRISLGVYVLGAIEPAERALLDEHLSICERCRDELASMAGLPAMLSRVSEEQIAQLGPPPEALFETVLAEVNRETRARRRRNVIVLIAAAAAWVIATGVGMGLVSRDDGRPAPHVSATASRPAQVARLVSGTDSVTGVWAQISLQPKRWGTAVDLRLTGVPGGSHCRIVVVDKHGRSDIAGAWAMPYAAREGSAEYQGSSMIASDQVASVEIRTVDGQRLLRIPV